MKKKKILIFLNQTSLAHTQIINSKFLRLITKKNKVLIASNYRLNNSKLLNKQNVRLKQIDKIKKNNFLIRALYSFVKSLKLHTSKNFHQNTTLKDFKSIFLKKNFHYSVYRIFLYIPLWLIFHNLLKVNFFLKTFQKLESHLFYSSNMENLLLKEKPDLVITTSPGWWEDDNFFLYSSKKLKIKSICIILSWDQPTGMGLMSSHCSEYLVWSNEIKKDLIKFHEVEEKNIHVLGAIHWDHYFLNREKINKNKNKNQKTKQILICLKSPTRTNHSNIFNMLRKIILTSYTKKIKFLIRPHPIYYSKRFYHLINDFTKIRSKYNSVSLQNLWGKINIEKQNLNTKSPDINFLIDNEIYFRNISKKNILESSLIINFFSTYTIEASILSKPIINFIDEKKINNIHKLGDKKNLYLDLRQNHVQRISKRIETAYTFNQLKKMINSYLSNSAKNKKNIDRFYKSETNIVGNSIFLISKFINNI